MIVYLVRHGIAEDFADNDSARRLTDEGIAKATRVARAFKKRVPRIEAILHSPLVRAMETARIFAEEYPKAELAEAAGLRPGDPASGALSLISGLGGLETLMIVGHEPHLSSLASILLTGRELPIMEFRKAGIASIEYHGVPGAGQLRFLLSPKWLNS